MRAWAALELVQSFGEGLAVLRRVAVAESRGHHQHQRLVLQVDDVIVRHAHHLVGDAERRNVQLFC